MINLLKPLREKIQPDFQFPLFSGIVRAQGINNIFNFLREHNLYSYTYT